MAAPSFKQVGMSDNDVSKFQDNVDQCLTFILGKEIIDGVLIEGLEITTSFQNIAHGLQRPARGYILVKTTAQITVWDNESANTLKKLFLSLRASANATISLWIF